MQIELYAIMRCDKNILYCLFVQSIHTYVAGGVVALGLAALLLALVALELLLLLLLLVPELAVEAAAGTTGAEGVGLDTGVVRTTNNFFFEADRCVGVFTAELLEFDPASAAADSSSS